jgi:UDP-glucose 4-epimerase
LKHPNFTFIKKDLTKVDLKSLTVGIDYILHHAAHPGVRESWGRNFKVYLKDNVLATQYLLEAVKNNGRIKKFIFASSSSVYGDALSLPTREEEPLNPISPYGVSKLAAERLCQVYFKNYGVPIIILRYFTVYGPGQREDMAFHRFFKAILNNQKITIFGDGRQTRDFTFISNVVEANFKAIQSKITGEVLNIGSGRKVSVNRVIKILEKITQRKAKLQYEERQKGEAKSTLADISKAKKVLGYSPEGDLVSTLQAQYKWMQEIISF